MTKRFVPSCSNPTADSADLDDIMRREVLMEWLMGHGFEPDMVEVPFFALHSTAQQRTQMALRCVAQVIVSLIDRHGESAYGNKPPDMDAVDYWIGHVEFDRLKDDGFRYFEH